MALVYSCGFAGGIGVDNISAVLNGLRKSAGGETIWVDMETSLRQVQEGAAEMQDIFAMDWAEECSEIVIGMGFCGDDSGGGDSAANL